MVHSRIPRICWRCLFSLVLGVAALALIPILATAGAALYVVMLVGVAAIVCIEVTRLVCAKALNLLGGAKDCADASNSGP